LSPRALLGRHERRHQPAVAGADDEDIAIYVLHGTSKEHPYDEKLLLRACDRDKRSRRLQRDLRGSRSRQGDFVSAVSTAFNNSLHAELVEASSAVFQQRANVAYLKFVE